MAAWALYFDTPLPFADGVRLQESLARARAANAIPDTVLLLEHRPVVTLGCRGRTSALRVPPERLAALGIELARASRGGDATFHAPGQLVLYPILRLGEQEADAHGYLANLEEVAIRTAAAFGVRAHRRQGMSGAWTEAGKLAAIGFRLKRWVTMHGMSFNVDLDVAGFRTIVPCGLEEPVTSLKELLGARCPALGDVRDEMRRQFEAVLGRKLEVFRAGGRLPPELAAVIKA